MDELLLRTRRSYCRSKTTKIFKNGKGATLGTLKKPNGEYTDTPEETLKLLIGVHFLTMAQIEEMTTF